LDSLIDGPKGLRIFADQKIGLVVLRRRCKFLPLLLCGVAGHGVAGQDSTPAQFNAEVGVSALNFRYKEFGDTGGLLDREEGYLPGAAFAIGARKGAWEVSAGGKWFRGRVDYDGQTNAGAPLKTKTDQAIIDVSASVGRWFAAPLQVMPYLGVGYWRWQRDILATAISSALSETYSWGYAFAGVRLTAVHRDRFDIDFDVRAIRPIQPKIEVDFGGSFDRASLDLHSRTGWRVATPVAWRFGSTKSLSVEPFWERQELGRSANGLLKRGGAPVGTLFEPSSKSNNFGLTVSFGLRF
jgi:hypothetical protein